MTDFSASVREAAERRAKRLGCTVDELYERDRAVLGEPLYPSVKCIHPVRLSDCSLLMMLSHVLECPTCAALVKMMANARGK